MTVFQCPEIHEGTCTSIPDAYQQSVSGKPVPDPECVECREHSIEETLDKPDTIPSEDSRSIYQKKKFEKLHSLIDSDQPPIVVPSRKWSGSWYCPIPAGKMKCSGFGIFTFLPPSLHGCCPPARKTEAIKWESGNGYSEQRV